MKSTIGRFVVVFLAAYGTMILLNTMFSLDNTQLWMLSSAAILAVVLVLTTRWVRRRDARRNR